MTTVNRAVALSVAEAAEQRRSIRVFDSARVPREDLETILRIAGLAPSAFNLQPWRWVIVESAALRQRLAAAAYHQRQFASAPAVIVLYTDTADAIAAVDEVLHPALDDHTRARARQAIERAISIRPDADREQWGESQGYIALGFLLLAAESIGYQTSPMLGFDQQAVKLALDLPPHVRVPALVAIGRGIETGLPHHRHPVARIARFL